MKNYKNRHQKQHKGWKLQNQLLQYISLFPHYHNITMNSSSQISAKKVSIRNKIRKEQLQSFFSSKRKLLLNCQPIEHTQNFMELYQLLSEGKDLPLNLVQMANFLGEQDPFRSFDSNGPPPSSQELQGHCFNLCHLVLINISSTFKGESKESVNNIISCITLVSNLLADPQVLNEPLFPIICDFLKQRYYNLELWGVDKETKEVGWMVSNLIGKQLTTNDDPKAIQYIMQWVEELIKVPDSFMLAVLYRNLPTFTNSLRNLYCLPPSQLPEEYKANIINIITDTIKNNLNADLPHKMLARVVDFLSSQLYICLAYCPTVISEVLIKKTMPLLGLLSFEVVNSAFRLLSLAVNAQVSALVPNQRRILESMQKIRGYLVQNYSSKLMQNMAIREVKYKRLMFKFLHLLLEAPSERTLCFLAFLVAAGLEDILANLIKYDDDQIKHDCRHLGILIYRLSQGRYGQQFLKETEGMEVLSFDRGSQHAI